MICVCYKIFMHLYLCLHPSIRLCIVKNLHLMQLDLYQCYAFLNPSHILTNHVPALRPFFIVPKLSYPFTWVNQCVFNGYCWLNKLFSCFLNSKNCKIFKIEIFYTCLLFLSYRPYATVIHIIEELKSMKGLLLISASMISLPG